MIALLLMVWDGFLLIGEGLGLASRHAERFADIAWLATASLTGTWLASMILMAVTW